MEENHGLGKDVGQRMPVEHERNYGLGMDALVSVCRHMLVEHERIHGLGMDALVSVMLLEHEQTYWPSQYFVKVVSCGNAPYTVRVSESRLPDESKFLHFAETRSADSTSTSRTSKPSKMREILGGQ